MIIYNIEEHLTCYCYDSNDKPLIEVRKFKQMETGEISLSCHEIVFVLKGKLRFTMYNNQCQVVSNNHIILLPAHNKMFFKAIAGSMILILRLKEDIQLCQTFNLERLDRYIKSVEKTNIVSTIEINARLKPFAHSLINTWEDGLKCLYYFKAKITEFLILLRAYYSEDQLYCFFNSVLTSDTIFAESVRSKHLQYSTVNEFADAMNMTPQHFSRRFYNVFGEAPYGWMQREKAKLIYGEICRSKKPMKKIAEEYGFNVQPNFNRFCKMAFGMNPGEIRKKRKLV